MTGAASLAFPGSRTLAGWWRQLASFQPTSLWVGYLFAHRVEALAAVRRLRKLEPFSRLVLRALDLGGSQPAADVIGRLDRQLHLGRPLLRQVLRALEAEGIVSGNGEEWTMTPRGRHGLLHEEYPSDSVERREFTFLERLDAAGVRRAPPHFAPLRRAPASPWNPDESCRFDPALLAGCAKEPESWKVHFGFPVDVERIFEPAGELDDDTTPAAWQRVVVDRPERLLAALILSEDGTVRVFAARQEGWALATHEPVLVVTQPWDALLPVLAEEPGGDAWQRAWLDWGQQKGLAEDLLRACVLTQASSRLRVQPPEAVLAQLRSARSEVLKGETWLLAGEGRVRLAARVEVA